MWWATPLLYFVVFFAYLEMRPGLGKVWLRPDNNNDLCVSWTSVKSLLVRPFRELFWWKPCFWEMNWVMWLCSGCMVDWMASRLVPS